MIKRLSTMTNPPPHTDRSWMQAQQSPPDIPVTPVEIYTLASSISNTDTDAVKALAMRAARAGQKLLALDLYRCVTVRNLVKQVLIGQLRYVAERLNAGDYKGLTRD